MHWSAWRKTSEKLKGQTLSKSKQIQNYLHVQELLWRSTLSAEVTSDLVGRQMSFRPLPPSAVAVRPLFWLGQGRFRQELILFCYRVLKKNWFFLARESWKRFDSLWPGSLVKELILFYKESIPNLFKFPRFSRIDPAPFLMRFPANLIHARRMILPRTANLFIHSGSASSADAAMGHRGGTVILPLTLRVIHRHQKPHIKSPLMKFNRL